jgi:hypothetical protein
MSNKIVLTRKKELNNRNKPYQIFINNNFYDNIYNGEENKIIVVESKQVELFLKIDWCSSQKKIINFENRNKKTFITKSSIPNYLWHLIVGGIIFSLFIHFLFDFKFSAYIPLLFVLIPVYKISIRKNNYLIIEEIEK